MVYGKVNRRFQGRYVELHTHSEHSDGLGYDYELIKLSDLEGVGMTNHEVAYGIKTHLDEMRKIGKVGIVGCELNVSSFCKSLNLGDTTESFKRKHFHLVILVKNQKGYKNFCKLITLARKKKAYNNAYINMMDLFNHREGLICLSGCIGGEIPQCFLHGEDSYAKVLALALEEVFGEDFYLEIQRHDLEGEELVNKGLINLSNELNIPLVATSDAHYMTEDDEVLYRIQKCKKYSGKKVLTLDQCKGLGGKDFHLIQPIDYIEKKWADIPHALDSTIDIMEKCKDFDLKDATCVDEYHFPKFKVPEGYSSSDSYFMKLCYDEAYRLIESGEVEDGNALIAALDRESNVIMTLGFIEYFLIVHRIIKKAKDKGIWVGPGRGSVGGSVVAYLLGITSDMYPLDYNFSFDRFLNEHRKGMPDIDVDIDSLKRDIVIADTIEDYKVDEEASNIASIATFNTWGVRGGINDVGRILGHKESFYRKISKLVPDLPGITFEDAFKASSGFREIYEEDEDARKIIDYAMRLYGTKTSLSRHPSGLIIADKSLTNYVCLDVIKDKESGEFIMIIQADKVEAEKLGLLKVDLLALSTGTDITHTLELIKKSGFKDFDLRKIPLDDIDVFFNVFGAGRTVGVFQSESPSMTKVLKDIFYLVKTHKLSINLLLALIQGICSNRPGPKDSIPDFLDNLVYPEKIKYLHDKMEPVLRDTHGILTYQEQVSKLFEVLAGYHPAKADLTRRAVSKKDFDLLEKERNVFIYGNEEVVGCVNNGIDAGTAEEIFDIIVKFAHYAFNMSHGGMYGLLTYQTAYLKYHFPVQYMTAVLSGCCRKNSTRKKLPKYINECKRLGIKLLPPDVNKSSVDFTMEGDNCIRFGLAAIKQVGIDCCKLIETERNEEGYSNIKDFVSKIGKNINSQKFQALTLSGALDCFENTRKYNYENTDSILKDKSSSTASISIFEAITGIKKSNNSTESKKDKGDEFSLADLMMHEESYISCFLVNEPLKEYQNIIRDSNTSSLKDIMIDVDDESFEDGDYEYNFEEGTTVRTIAMVIHADDRGDYIVYKVTDGTKVMSGTANEKYRNILKVGNVIHIKGKVSYGSFGTSLKAPTISRVFGKNDEIYSEDEVSVETNSAVEAYISHYSEIPKFLKLLDIGEGCPCKTDLYFYCNQTKYIFEFDYKIPLKNTDVLNFLKNNTEGLIIR